MAGEERRRTCPPVANAFAPAGSWARAFYQYAGKSRAGTYDLVVSRPGDTPVREPVTLTAGAVW
ncbi:MAG TPA: hypothetical protein VF142_12145, partial [Longimicrobium sp.]